MTCRADVKKLIYDDIYNEFAKNRYTIVRINDNTFRIANQQSTKGKSRAEHLRQATLIANEIKSRIYAKYGNNIDVNIEVPYYIGFPVEMTIEPLPEYIETVYAQVTPEKRTEFLTDLAFTFDPALYQQELMEDSPLKMIPYEVYEAQEKARLKEEAERKAREEALKKITIDEKGQYRMFQNVSDEGLLAAEKTIRDLAARMSDRIGIPSQIISDRTQKFKGKIENNTAVINLAYSTLDTPIHEILAHPIIRAIKNRKQINDKKIQEIQNMIDYPLKREDGYSFYDLGYEINTNNLEEYKKELNKIVQSLRLEQSTIPNLYQNLLKELEYGKGKEVLDRIKRDYIFKEGVNNKLEEFTTGHSTPSVYSFTPVMGRSKALYSSPRFKTKEEAIKWYGEQGYSDYTLEEQQEEALVELLGLYTAGRIDASKNLKLVSLLKQLLGRIKAFVRDLLFQKEVEIDKLPDNMTIGDIADLLAYSNNKLILPGNEVIYTTPDNQQFKTYAEASKHISDLARSVEEIDLSTVTLKRDLSKEQLEEINKLEKEKQEKENYLKSEQYQKDKRSKLKELNKKLEELKNKKVVLYSQEPYLTVEDKDKYGFQDFDYIRVESTYGRGNEYHKDILGENYEGYYIHGYNTSTGKPKKKILPITKEQAIEIWQKDESSKYEVGDRQEIFRTEDSITYLQEDSKIKYEISFIEQQIKNIRAGQNTIQNFIEKNKEYEQAKEIIEEWKKVNNIQYNPEEVYSRGQEFTSVFGAYSEFDGKLMMQNLLQHIEDNEKAGGEFIISAFTKPIDKEIYHLEGGGGKIKFKIYPKPQDIKWAANIDVYSGSTTINGMSASKAVSDKSSELVGVSFLKYPSLSNVDNVQPNLASIIDNLAHHHNELGITLTGNNFRLEYDEDIPYTTKKIIDGINSILDQKYGKLVKPEINKEKAFKEITKEEFENAKSKGKIIKPSREKEGYGKTEEVEYKGIKYVLQDNIIDPIYYYKSESIQPTQTNETLKESITSVEHRTLFDSSKKEYIVKQGNSFYRYADTKEEALSLAKNDDFFDINKPYEIIENISQKKQDRLNKEYTSQALINSKIAKLKEVAKKYPRSLIRSEVRPINQTSSIPMLGFEDLDIPFQKIPSAPQPTVSDISSIGPLEGEFMESERGQIGVNKQQLLMLLGPTMYNKPLAQVAVKELLQNSFDAIKARMNITGDTTTGNIDINVNYDNRTISIKDDGIGMTPDIVKNAFLSIGGTNKEGLDVSERSGGFGLAKVQFLLGSEYVKVITVRDGIKTSIEATAVQLYNDDFFINTEQTNEPNGSYVEVKIPEYYTTVEGVKRDIDFPGEYNSRPYERFDILTKPLIGDVNVNFSYTKNKEENTKVLPIGKNINEEMLPPLFSKIDFSWGTADLYMSIEKKERPSHKILSSGIFQFTNSFSFKDYENIPYDIVVNIKPSVSSTSEQYPFNNQREGFKNTVRQDITSLNAYLRKYASGEAEKDAKAVFSNITGLPKVDPSQVLTPEEREKLYGDIEKRVKENKQKISEDLESSQKERKVYSIIITSEGVTNKETGQLELSKEKEYRSSFKAEKEIEEVEAIETSNFNPALPQYHNNTNFDYLKIPGAAEFFSDFGSVVLDMVRFAGQELGYEYRKLRSEDEKFFAGVSIDKDYGGVHVRKIINAIFVNPLAFNVSSLEEAVGVALHVTIHEINHTTVSGEGANFTTALAVLWGKIYATGKYGFYEGLFRSVYKKHFDTFKQLKNEYDKSTTRNLSKSFSGDEIKGSTFRDIQRNVDDVSTRQTSEEGYRGDTENYREDKTGEIILSKISNLQLDRIISKQGRDLSVPLLPTVETEEKKLLNIPDIAVEAEFQQKHCK